MSELKIDLICDDKCAECSQEKNGVRFRFNYFQKAFLCWEHFRLLQDAMKPGRVEIRSCDHTSFADTHNSYCVFCTPLELTNPRWEASLCTTTVLVSKAARLSAL